MGVYVGDSLVAGNVGEVYTKAQVDTMIANAVALAEPVGSIKPFAGTTVPDGYLLCDGSAISRTTYAALFAVIGTTYGTGDGSTTFNIPNYTEKTFWQNSTATPGLFYVGSVPNITGFTDFWYVGDGTATPTGAFYNALEPLVNYTAQLVASTGTKYKQLLSFDASRVSQTYGRGNATGDYNSVVPRSLSCKFCIKY